MDKEKVDEAEGKIFELERLVKLHANTHTLSHIHIHTLTHTHIHTHKHHVHKHHVHTLFHH